MKQTNCCWGSRNLAKERRNFPFRETLRAVDRGSMCFPSLVRSPSLPTPPLLPPRHCSSSGAELKGNGGFVPRYRRPAATSMTDETSLFVRAEESQTCLILHGKACHIGQVKRERGEERERERERERGEDRDGNLRRASREPGQTENWKL